MFDIVLCRNVMIYFDAQTKASVLSRMARVVERDGYLVLGAAETVVGLTDVFKAIPERRSLFTLNPNARQAPTPRLPALTSGR
jgi:chemotaxis protein methyltransferase CheR